MDNRRFTMGPSRAPRGGVKRLHSSSVATPSKLPRVSMATPQRRPQSFAPRRPVPVSLPPSQPSSQSAEHREAAPRVSTLNRPSFVATMTERPHKSKLLSDPRAIRDPEFQKSAMRTIIRYLTDAGYGPVTVQTIRGLSYRTFQQIFKFLHLRLAPNYIYPDKFEDAFIDILKRSFRYPFAETLSPKALFSIAAPHSYPSFLALLLWMVEVCKFFDTTRERYANSLLNEEEEDRSEYANVLFFDYSWVTYCAFLNGANTYEKYDKKLEQLFEHGKDLFRGDVTQVTEANRVRQEKLDSLRSRPRVKEERLRYRKEMEEDMAKFEEYTEEKRKRIAKYAESISKGERELQTLAARCTQTEREHTELRDQFKAMDISLEEIQQLAQEQMELENASVEAQGAIQRLTKEKAVLEASYSQILSRAEEVRKVCSALAAELPIDDPFEPSDSPSAEQVEAVKRKTTQLEKLKQQYEASDSKIRKHIAATQKKLSTAQSRIVEQKRVIAGLNESTEKAKEAYEAARQRFLKEAENSNANMAEKENEMRNQKRVAKIELYNNQKAEKELQAKIVEYRAKAAARHQAMVQEGEQNLGQLSAMRSHVERVASTTKPPSES